MKFVVFGANGNTGKKLVSLLLNNGHEVKAFVRQLDSISISHDNLEVVEGQLADKELISKTIVGTDGVVSTLGGRSLRQHSVQIMEGIENIVKSMTNHGIKRLVYLSSVGTGESRYYMGPIIRFMVCDLMLKVPLADHQKNEQTIKNGGLSFTIVKPGGLSDDDVITDYEKGSHSIKLKGNPKISRKTVAKAIVDILERNENLKEEIWLLSK